MNWLKWLLDLLRGKQPPKPPPIDPIKPTELHAQLLAAANDVRKAKGLATWQADTLLDSLAQRQAEYCARLQALDHKDSQGRWPDERARDAGYEGQQTSEILAAWQRTPQEAVDSWISSNVGHREALLSQVYNECGRGIARDTQGRYYWCLFPGRGMLLMQIGVYHAIDSTKES